MPEQWSRWEPIKELNILYTLDAVYITRDFLEIRLSSNYRENQQLQIKFSSYVKSFKNTYESFRQKLIFDLIQNYNKNFYEKWTFFKINNSEYLRWLSQQSMGTTDSPKLIHYICFTQNHIVEVIDDTEPIVEWLNSNPVFKKE